MMQTYDLKISNGKVYTSAGLTDADILVQGEKIALLAQHRSPFAARREVDATGKVILPGIVDLHVHVREPGYAYKEDYLSASQAAAAGGVTTMVDMPNVEPPTIDVKLFEEKKALAQQKSVIDFGHFVAGLNPQEVPRLAEAGVTGFKIFQVADRYPHDSRLAEFDHAKLLQDFIAIEKTGLVCVVHPWDQSLANYFAERWFSEGKPRDIITYSQMKAKDIINSLGITVLIGLQRESKVRLHVVHTHPKWSLIQLKRAKGDGQRITVEIDPKYYHMTHDDLKQKGPICMPGGYVTEDPDRMRVIWECLADGTIDNIASEHAPHTMEEMNISLTNAWKAPLGSPQLDHFLSVLITDVHQGKMSMDVLVRTLSANPARILGIYPQKGVILPGSDADLVVVDWDRERVLDDKGLYTKVGHSPYAGWKVKGVPVMTIARGEVVAEDGKVIGKPGRGKYIAGRPHSREI
jgi:dihydroorotase